MTYRVEISPSALNDAEAAFLWHQKESPKTAADWYNGLVDAILSLETFPNRCPIAPESEAIGREVRQLFYQRHRILFGVSGQVVRIYRIRHTSRDWLSPEEL